MREGESNFSINNRTMNCGYRFFAEFLIYLEEDYFPFFVLSLHLVDCILICKHYL